MTEKSTFTLEEVSAIAMNAINRDRQIVFLRWALQTGEHMQIPHETYGAGMILYKAVAGIVDKPEKEKKVDKEENEEVEEEVSYYGEEEA